MGVAVIQAIVGGLGWATYGPQFRPLDWAITLSFLIYVGLSVWSRWQAIVASCTGSLIYGVFLGYQATLSVTLLFTGLVFKGPIVLLLVAAVVMAIWSRSTRSAPTA
jgi:hypothetical protein